MSARGLLLSMRFVRLCVEPSQKIPIEAESTMSWNDIDVLGDADPFRMMKTAYL